MTPLIDFMFSQQGADVLVETRPARGGVVPVGERADERTRPALIACVGGRTIEAAR
jgi:hypothetical protein